MFRLFLLPQNPAILYSVVYLTSGSNVSEIWMVLTVFVRGSMLLSTNWNLMVI
jgi:hypothetical protein